MHAPGMVRDAIVDFLTLHGEDANAAEIHQEVVGRLGPVPESSVRSYLRLNTPTIFTRTGRGRYVLNDAERTRSQKPASFRSVSVGPSRLYHGDCFDWLAQQPSQSVHAVVTDPPYGLIEYTPKEQIKLRTGRGGVWRIPPSFDGHQRSPLPRFTILSSDDHQQLWTFFRRLAVSIRRVAVPGANVIVASNPLLSHLVAGAMNEGGLELRGYLARLVMTMRGGDRPKNAHREFADVSVMPRSMWEPWVVLRTPLEGRVQDNLRLWGTGGFRRPSAEKPFGDVVRSHPTSGAERRLAAHPSLKPQAFLRPLVRAALPLGQGVVLDPFAGSGSTLAAANAVGYASLGVESDTQYFEVAARSIEALSGLSVKNDPGMDNLETASPKKRSPKRAFA